MTYKIVYLVKKTINLKFDSVNISNSVRKSGSNMKNINFGMLAYSPERKWF
jgi:hypothetical protein